jgi:hypothetical protein|tara:strand:+ start:395 stop:715 length:321 start_codon:yes stop_codon:yes gene_type:complete
MEIKKLSSLLVTLIILNNVISLIPLPSIIDTLAIIGATVLLMIGISKGGTIGKAYLVTCFLVGIYALIAILSFVGVSLPFAGFLFLAYRWVMIAALGLLIFQVFSD